MAGLTTLGLIGAAAEPTFNINLLACREVLVTGFGQASKGGAVEPLGLFPLLPGTGGVLAACSYTKVGDALDGASLVPAGDTEGLKSLASTMVPISRKGMRADTTAIIHGGGHVIPNST